MIPRPPTSRPGAALLLVLAVLVLTVAALAPLAQLSALSMHDRGTRAAEAGADDLLRAAEAPLLRWLDDHALRATLPPDAAAPAVPVLRDRWTARAETALTITAFDQQGMVPLPLIGIDRALTLVLPDDLRALRSDRGAPAGLDALDVPKGRARFPLADAVESPTAAGALVATHAGSPAAINVNTAPMPLVEAALGSRGRGGLDAIRAARRAGRLFNPGSGDSKGENPIDGRAIVEITGVSRAWAFRIDVRVDAVRRSWWAVYAQTGSTWERRQLLAILE